MPKVDEVEVPQPSHDWSPPEDNRPHAYTRCDTCGKTDDHPKHHYGAETNHHDCIPARILDDLDLDGTHLADIIEACRKGKKGDALRSHIHNTHPATLAAKKGAKS